MILQLSIMELQIKNPFPVKATIIKEQAGNVFQNFNKLSRNIKKIIYDNHRKFNS